MNSKPIFIVYFTSDVQNDIHYKISWNPIYSHTKTLSQFIQTCVYNVMFTKKFGNQRVISFQRCLFPRERDGWTAEMSHYQAISLKCSLIVR